MWTDTHQSFPTNKAEEEPTRADFKTAFNLMETKDKVENLGLRVGAWELGQQQIFLI